LSAECLIEAEIRPGDAVSRVEIEFSLWRAKVEGFWGDEAVA
jgi:hypothetical protein